MAEAQKYVAVENFSLNLDNGKSQIDVKRGEELMFDGLYVDCRGEHGQARSLIKVIGEWIKPANGGSNQATIGTSSPMSPRPVSASNMTGGRIIEQSDLTREAGIQPSNESEEAELKRLVNQYENTPPPTHISQRTTDDMADMRKEAKAQVIVENQDAQEVAKVSDKGPAVQNSSGVEIAPQTAKKASVISPEGNVAKKTSYEKKPAEPPERKRLKVEKDASGVEVRKVKSPAIHRNEIKTSTVESRREVSSEEDVAIETNYGTETHTDVGSSTQAQLERDVIMKKPVTTPERPKREVIAEASSDGVVVRKVSKNPEDNMTTREGITSKVTVGAGGDVDTGDVTFSSNSEINEGKATFHKTSDAVVDLGGGGFDDGEIDVNDILDGV